MSHDHHHMMGHDGHDMGAHGASMETTTMHDHAAMVAETTTVHNHGASDSGMMMMMQVFFFNSLNSKLRIEIITSLIFLSQMYFYADYKAVVLFQGWDIQTVGAMVGSCIGIFLMGILYEGLKYFR